MTPPSQPSDAAVRAAGVVVEVEPDITVRAGLDVRKNGTPVGSLRNMAYILTNDDRLSGRLRWSRFEHLVVYDGKPLRDVDLSKIAIWMDDVYGVRGAADNLHRAVNLVAEEHAFHRMVVELAERGFVEKTPGVARSLRVLVRRADLPELEG